MADPTEFGQEGIHRRSAAGVFLPKVRAWFVREVLPLEADLMQFLHHHWHNKSDISDLRQDVYVRVLERARQEIPEHTRRFVFVTARNLLIDRIRREHIVPFDAVADVDALGMALDAPGPDRSAIARDELRKLHVALDRLPQRSREAVVLRRITGLTGREIAVRMGISEAAVSKHIDNGICLLADILYSDPPEKRRQK